MCYENYTIFLGGRYVGSYRKSVVSKARQVFQNEDWEGQALSSVLNLQF